MRGMDWSWKGKYSGSSQELIGRSAGRLDNNKRYSLVLDREKPFSEFKLIKYTFQTYNKTY
jgi:hypothetical protein